MQSIFTVEDGNFLWKISFFLTCRENCSNPRSKHHKLVGTDYEKEGEREREKRYSLTFRQYSRMEILSVRQVVRLGSDVHFPVSKSRYWLMNEEESQTMATWGSLCGASSFSPFSGDTVDPTFTFAPSAWSKTQKKISQGPLYNEQHQNFKWENFQPLPLSQAENI